MNLMTPQRRFHVSNRAALIAALVLAITSFAGLYNGKAFNSGYEQNATTVTAQADNNAGASNSNKRKLSISLLLFGRG